jgi:hypothetical protein
MTPIQAIRAKCLDCCCDQANEVKLCTAIRCPLWPFRLGKNPNIKPREYTEEQREAMRQRLKKAMEAKCDGDN